MVGSFGKTDSSSISVVLIATPFMSRDTLDVVVDGRNSATIDNGRFPVMCTPEDGEAL
jgi:hypothetical protein